MVAPSYVYHSPQLNEFLGFRKFLETFMKRYIAWCMRLVPWLT